jgi:hypothetical protein
VAVAAVAVSAAETIATATNRTERPSRTLDGALLLKRPITHPLKPFYPPNHARFEPCAFSRKNRVYAANRFNG